MSANHTVTIDNNIATPLTPSLSGFVPGVGIARDVVVDTTRGLAFVASDQFGLSVVNITNPLQPSAIGAADQPFMGSRVAISGSLAVVSAASNGMIVLDVSTPASPRILSAVTGGSMGPVAISGNYAYTVEWVSGATSYLQLLVISLADPQNPVIVGKRTVPGNADLKTSGALVYLAAGSAGLQIIDVSNPSAPTLRATLDTPGSARGVAVSGGYAYIADNTSIQVANVSNPSNPVAVGSLAMAATTLAHANNRVYALNGSELKIVDVANVYAPQLLSTWDNMGSQGITAAGNTVYLASPQVHATMNTAGLYLIDVSTPTSPVLQSNVYGGFESSGVAVGGTLAVASGGLAGLRVVNIADPTSPKVLSSIMGGSMGPVAVSGQYAYTIEQVSGTTSYLQLLVINLINPQNPVIAGKLTVAGNNDLKVAGSLVYLAAGSTGLQIIDVSNPSAPTIRSTLNTPGSARGVAVSGGYAYIADNTSIQVANVSNPSNPVTVGSLAMTATALAYANNRVYVLNGSELKIVDVANVSVPQLLSTWDNLGSQGITALDRTVLLARPGLNHSDVNEGVYVMDATDPMNVVIVEQVIVPGTTRRIAAQGSFAFASDSHGIVSIISLYE